MSLGSFLKDFGKVAAKFGPLLITEVAPELAPVATIISHAIGDAEGIPGASGADKLQHVVSIAADAAQTFNSLSHSTKISLPDFNSIVAHAVAAVVAASNTLTKPQPALN